MRVSFLIFDIDGEGGTEQSVITQANALSTLGVNVSILSVVRRAGGPPASLHPGVTVEGLADRSVPGASRSTHAVVDDDLAARLDDRASVVVPSRWDMQYSALTDAVCAERLPELGVDVVVTVSPALLALAVQLIPSRIALVHQEHRSSGQRLEGMEALLTFAPRADLVTLLTPSARNWLHEALGVAAPPMIVIPNPLAECFRPRSTLETRLIVAGGRLVREKQFAKLIRAFGAVADVIPDWRLRIVGSGSHRLDLTQLTRKLGLYDRVELPGRSADMVSEWATASISAVTSRTEGLSLVAQEAMAAGVPVVAFDAPSGPRALIRHEANGLLVEPDSIPGLSSALLRLATDDELRHALGAAALLSSRQYDATAIAQRWLTAFQEVVARRTAQPNRVLRRVVDAADRPEVEQLPEVGSELTPADARSLAVRWAVRCAKRASSRWFVIPPHGTSAAIVVLPMADRIAFFDELAGPGSPAVLSLVDSAGKGWPERRGTLAEVARDVAPARTGRVTLEPWPSVQGLPGMLSTGCSVEVEFWETAPDGALVSAGWNTYTDRLPAGVETVETEVEGVRVRTLPLMTEPTILDCTFPVDVVYTWVDGSDPEWRDARDARLAPLRGTPRANESSGRARYESWDELRYSLRSLHLFAPWVRTIYLVTAGQVPSWLRRHPKITLVHHREILPDEALPTFNSHAIETGLHKIPDLAEQFIYLNDDIVLGRPLSPHRFFTPSGQNCVFFSAHRLGLDEEADPPPWLKAALNNRRLLRERFGVVSTTSLAHTPHPHRRSVLEEIERTFPDEIARTARSPFRSDDDISLLSSFAQHFGLATGTAVVGNNVSEYVDISSSGVGRGLRRLQSREQDSFCLGDHHEHARTPSALRAMLDRFFAAYLPVAAPWEASD